MTSNQKLWSLRLASVPALLLLPFACAAIAMALANLFSHNDYPRGEVLIGMLVGILAAIILSSRTVFTPRNSSLKRVFYTLLLLFAFDILSVPFAALICNSPATADRDGHKPEDIARAFISAVDADDYETAASFFTKQSVNEVQHNSAYEHSFPHYCSRFKGLDSVELERSWRGKGNYWRLGMSGKRNGEQAGYSFYFDRVGNKWLMTISEMSSFWDEAEESEPHANLIITNYRLGDDRNDYPPRAKAGDKTVLVHRIGHNRAIPAYRPLSEGDGAFRCRIRPGTYVIDTRKSRGS